MTKLTAKEVARKYKGKYIEVTKLPFWDTNDKGESLYSVHKAYKDIHEDTTLVTNEDFINNY